MPPFEFAFRTGKVTIDLEQCAGCTSHACVSACARFGGDLFKIEDGHPVLTMTPEEAGRRCVEDLACEIYCHSDGCGALRLVLESFGLDEYRKKIGVD